MPVTVPNKGSFGVTLAYRCPADCALRVALYSPDGTW